MDVLSMKHEIKALPPPWGSMAQKKNNSEQNSSILVIFLKHLDCTTLQTDYCDM